VADRLRLGDEPLPGGDTGDQRRPQLLGRIGDRLEAPDDALGAKSLGQVPVLLSHVPSAANVVDGLVEESTLATPLPSVVGP
jgi:hypothetical protein